MIKSGTTAFADSGGVHMDRVADAVIESGMRAAIAKSTMDMGNAITGAMKETANEAIENTKKLYQKYQGAGDGRVDIWFAIRQVMTCSRELIAMVGESAKEFHTGIHAHLCEHNDNINNNFYLDTEISPKSMGILDGFAGKGLLQLTTLNSLNTRWMQLL